MTLRQDILPKALEMKSSLPKSTKTTEKVRKLFTVWFSKELTIPSCRLFDLEKSAAKLSTSNIYYDIVVS